MWLYDAFCDFVAENMHPRNEVFILNMKNQLADTDNTTQVKLSLNVHRYDFDCSVH